ncbi:hypothetical protein BVY01_03370 [bacterium I07]|nr:hypothetical protein BVY01_03370 [bacterium I07]
MTGTDKESHSHSDLNPVQKQAVEETEGPVLVLAGAGSGKTRVLTYRIAHLIHDLQIAPWEILSMTFTNKAAGEMKERVDRLVDAKGLWIGTFHSIFAKMLRWEAERIGYSPEYVIYDADDQERLIKSIMSDFGISPSQFNPRAVSATISRAKNSLIDSESFAKNVSSPFETTVSSIYPEYQSRLRMSQAFDFDDLITVPILLFNQNSDILEKYRQRFRYILVDEYQDTNRAQYQLVQMLSDTHRNICVVGDDDQSIYRWRGADIRNILEFEKDFPDARIFRLEQNYRSTKTILAAAISVVECNQSRKGKTLWTEQESGEKITLIENEDDKAEARNVIEKIKSEVYQNKRAFHDFALLYRTNAQSRLLEEALRRSSMPYIIVGGVRFYERKEIKDILAYLRLIANPYDSVSLKRIINFPLRGIGQTTLQKLEYWSYKNGKPLFESLSNEVVETISKRIQDSINDFKQLIKKYIDLKDQISPNELVHALVDDVGFLTLYKEDLSIDSQTRAENVREFLTAVTDYVLQADNPTLASFLEQVSLISDIDSWDDRSNAITLMTLHCAKGLEFPVVFITGMEESLFPVFRSLEEPAALEEERRLFYVGLTRAQKKVYLSWAQMRHRFNDNSYRLPSRFLEEIDQELLVKEKTGGGSPFVRRSYRERIINGPMSQTQIADEFSQEKSDLYPGVWVEHDMFGRGMILKVEGRGKAQKVSVRFDGDIEKKFLTEYARFTIILE